MSNNTYVCESPEIFVEAVPNMHTAMNVELAGPSYGAITGSLAERSGTAKYRFGVTTGFRVGTHKVTVYPTTNTVEGKLVGSFIVRSKLDISCL